MIPVPAHIILQSRRRDRGGGGEREELVGQRDKIPGQREHGEQEGARRGEWERRAGGVNVHIINLDYLGD